MCYCVMCLSLCSHPMFVSAKASSYRSVAVASFIAITLFTAVFRVDSGVAFKHDVTLAQLGWLRAIFLCFGLCLSRTDCYQTNFLFVVVVPLLVMPLLTAFMLTCNSRRILLWTKSLRSTTPQQRKKKKL
jgi:hypothetical protein